MKTFNIEDTAMILIDHQVGTTTWASSTPLELLQKNVIILAKFAKGLPEMEYHPQAIADARRFILSFQ